MRQTAKKLAAVNTKGERMHLKTSVKEQKPWHPNTE